MVRFINNEYEKLESIQNRLNNRLEHKTTLFAMTDRQLPTIAYYYCREMVQVSIHLWNQKVK